MALAATPTTSTPPAGTPTTTTAMALQVRPKFPTLGPLKGLKIEAKNLTQF